MSTHPRNHGGMLNWRAFTFAVVLCLVVTCLFGSRRASAWQKPPQRPVKKAAAAPRHRQAPGKRNAGKSEDFAEGILIQALDGTTSVSLSEEKPIFNPASNTKLATSLVVLRKFGPDYTFQTAVRTNGTLNDHGQLQGDLFVDGRYMLFGDRQAHELVDLLKKRGIVEVHGDLYVSPDFSMNLEATGLPAGKLLLKILDPWHGRQHQGVNLQAGEPQLIILGQLKVGLPPASSTLIAEHTSPPLKDILKVMLCFSDNTMAQMFGDMVGGPQALTAFVINQLGVAADEVAFATTSGLGVNRISPRAMMKVLRALRAELALANLQLSDILAVAGIDDGTLKKRFTEPQFIGSVIGKTGTLTETDQGVAALSGEMHTLSAGIFLFVIFEEHGDVLGFRERQDKMLKQFLQAHSGAKAITYTPILPRVDHEDFWK